MVLHLRMIATVLQEDWAKHGPCEANPHKQTGDTDFLQILAHQLCEWGKTSFSEEVRVPNSMQVALK